jgi:hypothetical protein
MNIVTINKKEYLQVEEGKKLVRENLISKEQLVNEREMLRNNKRRHQDEIDEINIKVNELTELINLFKV